jgi:hypothetical protein
MMRHAAGLPGQVAAPPGPASLPVDHAAATARSSARLIRRLPLGSRIT